jgi:hypothetical protein
MRPYTLLYTLLFTLSYTLSFISSQSMRHEYEAVQTAKGTQADEMRAMKDRMLLGVSAL